MSRKSETHPLSVAYLLVFGACIFVWPVVLGIPSVPLRFAWIAVAFALLCGSGVFLQRALAHSPGRVFRARPLPWWLLILTCVALSPALFFVPPHAFSDESTIAIPSLTVLGHIARFIGWPLMNAGAIAVIAAVIFLSRMLKLWQAMTIVALMALGAGALAVLSHSVTNLATRFPPVVHLLQSLVMGIGQGDLAMMRGVNILWTILLGVTLWHCTPGWNTVGRIVAFAALILGPMGWIYHVSLYQACGEITLGLCAALLVSAMIQDPKKQAWAPYAAIIFSVWMLYRPTAVIAIALCIVLLWLTRRRQAAKVIMLVAGPVACIWLALYPTYHYSFILNPGKGALFPAADMGQPLLPLLTTIQALPGQFHPLVIGLLLLSSCVVFLRGSNAWRITLGVAWLIGLSTSGVQQLIQLPVYWGYPRFNILLLLPLAVGLAGVCSLPSLSRKLQIGFAAIIVVLLGAVTPFDTVSFAHRLRVDSPAIYKTTTGGDSPLPVAVITERILARYPKAVFVIPDGTYFDLYVASGLLTVRQRSELLARGKAWTPESPDRPVIVQAPVVTSYGPNVPDEYADRLRAAREWALAQPKYQVMKMGLEEVVVVWQ
jgi:hypothetical protein